MDTEDVKILLLSLSSGVTLKEEKEKEQTIIVV